ncbi:SLATT domain-containing protein [Gardnerella vaginalis]|uniref:SLATT domain-containing protein n=1 Tax=Gardnerella vaginalis TaxID=2702 RepID=UPI0039EE02B6
MESDKSYRARLKNQIKDACGKVIYTYTAHHKLADRLEKENKYVKNAQIILTALSSCGFFYSIITNKVISTWIGGITAVLSLCLNLYAKEYKIQNEVSQHRNAANVLWGIREEYVSLLVDFEVLDDSEIQKKRDVLCNKVSEVNNNYPATDERSYRAAQKALQKEEEQTFKENEVDSILPNGIDK